jgi:hypothetical protein
MGWKDNWGEILRIDSNHDRRRAQFGFCVFAPPEQPGASSPPEQPGASPRGVYARSGFLRGDDSRRGSPPPEGVFQLEDQKLRLMFPPGEKLQGSGPFESREE